MIQVAYWYSDQIVVVRFLSKSALLNNTDDLNAISLHKTFWNIYRPLCDIIRPFVGTNRSWMLAVPRKFSCNSSGLRAIIISIQRHWLQTKLLSKPSQTLNLNLPSDTSSQLLFYSKFNDEKSDIIAYQKHPSTLLHFVPFTLPAFFFFEFYNYSISNSVRFVLFRCLL